MQITLYYAPYACSLVPYVALTEADAEFEVSPLNIRKKKHMTSDYLKLNPKHKVPLLIVDGQTLSENVAIQLWFARTYPYANLLPKDLWLEARAVSVLAWCSSGIHPHISRMNAPLKFCDTPDSDIRVRVLAGKALFEAYEIAEDMLDRREYFFDHFTTADIYLFWCLRRTMMFDLDLSMFQNCQAHYERVSSRASVKRALSFEEDVLENFDAMP